MILEDDDSTYYDVLEVSPDSSPQEIREAYLRLKSAYSRDSVALYTLISKEETEGMLRRIEQAYHVLSNPEKRKEYDRNHRLMEDGQEFAPSAFRFGTGQQKIISIDRVPPMEDTGDEGDPLVAPRTDFSGQPIAQPALAPVPQAAMAEVLPAGAAARAIHESAAPVPSSAAGVQPRVAHAGAGATAPSRDELSRILDGESEWHGPVIRKVRELQGLSLEELSEYTKITKKYIRAIEDEDYASLPAPVYLRGFVVQIAKKLRIPHERAATAYLARYRSSLPDKD
ncbi:MAG: helix-turn-helix domain-containing protein [Bdellovibrionales bacterium]|nr:helix-turn-helix domain-containing protein [Bdellovibrionales bacterium]